MELAAAAIAAIGVVVAALIPVARDAFRDQRKKRHDTDQVPLYKPSGEIHKMVTRKGK
jgi:hypothetical protein